jgi:hypothetical protein
LSSAALAWSHWWSENPAGYLEMTTVRYQENGQVLVPMRPFFEGVGWDVDWEPIGRRITATEGDARLDMWVNSATGLYNGQPQTLPAPPRFIEGTVYVPLRFVSGITGARVEYLGRTVRVISPDGVVLMVHLAGA